MVGRLLYINKTRPNISFSVQKIFPVDVSTLSNSFSCCISFDRISKIESRAKKNPHSQSSLKLKALCNSDWAKYIDFRRSVTGFYILLGDSLVSWKSKKQPIIYHFSVEVEYQDIGFITCELIWLKQLLKYFHIYHHDVALLFYDNDATIKISTNPTFHERTKHIELDCHFVRDKVVN